MTKQFCDLCGQPALLTQPDLSVAFPDMAWAGVKSVPGSVVDGTWTPYVRATVVFEVHNAPGGGRPVNPDLCGKCIASLLEEMADNLPGNPPTP